jgi:deoxyribonuclease-4
MQTLNCISIKQKQGLDYGPVTSNFIGGHISKGTNIKNTLQQHFSRWGTRPCQVFLRNPRTGRISKKTLNDTIGMGDITKRMNGVFYVHAPYVLNLCKEEDPSDRWTHRILKEELEMTYKMGGRGVVVHTGTKGKNDKSWATDMMEKNIRRVLPFAKPECPLLLETPCGEGTEICWELSELSSFFDRFTEEEIKNLGMCFDSAHVWGAGYHPTDYIISWNNRVPIKLIHFNDSKVEKGSKVDRHEIPGIGKIGKTEMMDLARIGKTMNIPMVHE